MIDGITNADAIPALERLMQFAGGRHRVIVNNIANLDTPGFRPLDVSVRAFQTRLAEAVDRSRSRNGNAGGALEIDSGDGIEFAPTGVVLYPTPRGDNILFHDGNDRDPEKLMQSLVENFMAFRAAADLLRNRFDMLNTAIRERV